ncbi:hypothetical protein JNL27_16850, partial [bacterium]|nr:hypothetical protein [bacterium]
AVVENFIMHYTNVDSIPNVVQYSQEATYELSGDYGKKMLILEYHLTPGAYEDSLASSENESRYENEYRGSVSRGFPHTFFNGKQTFIQGASSTATVKSRYKNILDSLILKKVKLFCEPDLTFANGVLTVGGKIARYGNESIGDLVVEMFILENKGDYLYYTVRQKLLSQTISQLSPKEVRDLEDREFVIPNGYNQNQLSVAILIKDNISKKILQAALAE